MCGSHLMKPSWFWRLVIAWGPARVDGRGVLCWMVAEVLRIAEGNLVRDWRRRGTIEG